MAAEPPAPDPRVIAAYLDDVELELDAARRLVADPPNRFAAFHLQQASEGAARPRPIGDRRHRRCAASGKGGGGWHSGDPAVARPRWSHPPSSALPRNGAGGTGGGDRVFKPLADPHRERPTVALGEFSRKICDLLTFKSTHGENIKARRMGSGHREDPGAATGVAEAGTCDHLYISSPA